MRLCLLSQGPGIHMQFGQILDYATPHFQTHPSIFLLFVFNPTRKHHEIVCQNPLKCLHEVICDQTIVVVAILSWYVVVTVTPKRIEKIEQHLSLITILANFTKFYLSWGLWLSTFSSALAALTRSQLPGMWRPWLGEFSKPRSWLPEVIYIYIYIICSYYI